MHHFCRFFTLPLPNFLLITLDRALLTSLFSGNDAGSKYCGAYSSSHSGRTSVTVRINWGQQCLGKYTYIGGGEHKFIVDDPLWGRVETTG